MFDFMPPIGSTARRIDSPPLVHTIAQIRFNPAGRFSKHAAATEFQRRLITMYPRLLPEAQALFVGLPGESKPETTKQYRLTDVDNDWSCVIGAQHLTIETTAYVTWIEMRERLVAALDVLADMDPPAVRERIGLRYINHIPANEDGGFDGRVNLQLLQPFGGQPWLGALTMSLGQAVVSDGNAQMAIRYGLGGVPGDPSAKVWLLDIDCSDEVPAAFELTASMDCFDQFNDAATRCFVELAGAAYSVAVTGGK